MADYVAPAGTLSPSWSGSNAYRGPVTRLSPSWSGPQQTITPAGWSALVPGAAALVPQQVARPVGLDATAFGSTWALTKKFNYRPRQYRIDGTWGGAQPYTRPTGTLNVTFDNSLGYISPNGFDASSFGSTTVFGTQFVQPVGFDPLAMGKAVYALFSYQYAPPQWTLTGSWVGKAAYTPPHDALNGAWTLPIEAKIVALTGWVDGAVGGVTLYNQTQYAIPAGIAPDSVLAPGVANAARALLPSGINSQAFGAQVVSAATRTLLPSGVNLLSVGALTAQLQHRPIALTGFDSLAVANTLAVTNRNRYVAVGNIGTAAYGTPSVVLYTRYLQQTGFVATAYGATRVSHGKQTLLVPSIAPPALGTAWVSMSPRVIETAGRDTAAVAIPLVGGTRYLLPPGFDPLAFGSRIIPESQTVAPLGFREQWGQQEIKNRLTYAAPKGFQSTGQEEFRWGRAEMWNLRQYVTMVYDPDSGLNPPPWSQWTLVENRNRVVGAIGVTPPAWGYTQIDNNARVIQPAGMNPPGYPGTDKVGMVAYGVRRLPIDGVEPPLISTWHAVFNAAKVLAPPGAVTTAFGTAALENNRRYFDRIGNFDSATIGTAFIDFAIRTLAVEPRYSIAPPDVKLPEVKLYTRYLAPLGTDMLGIGLAALSIHFNKIEPKWVHRDLVGEPRAYNVTPEMRGYGWNSEEFGDAFVRLQWRPVKVDGTSMQLFGQAKIADRKQGITVPGTNLMKLGDKLVVTKTGAPPNTPQTIEVDSLVNSQSVFGTPGLNQYVLYTVGVSPPDTGKPAVRIMGATVDAGIKVDGYGTPTVGLKNRGITVPAWDDALVYQPGKPVMSPLTIWAVKEAPAQAKANHPVPDLHYVGETNIYPPGERFGTARVSTYLGILRPSTLDSMVSFGIQSVYLKRRYITPEGLQAYRMGWVNVGDGKETLTQFGGADALVAGLPTVARAPYTGPQTVVPAGVASMAFGSATWVSLLHRTYQLAGVNALVMGSSRGDSPYQWQTLHVGPPMPTIPAGFDASQFGATWVSLRVRGLEAKGFATFSMDYDPARFADRLRVRNAFVPSGPPVQAITPVGVDALGAGVPNVRPGVHYIRPDGDADQFRKGAF